MEYAPLPNSKDGILFRGEPAIGRLHAMDSARGLAILLVVFGHAWRGAEAADLIPDFDFFRTVDAAVYAFHMPFFFFLAGLLFFDTLQKYGMKPLLEGRVKRLLWPMVLWGWIFFALKLFAGSSVNTPVSFTDFPIIPLPPYEHLWFLWALFLMQSGLICAYAFGLRICSPYVSRVGAIVLAVVLALINPFLSVPSLVFGPAVEHFPYLLAGIGLGGLAAYRPSALLAGGAAAAFVIMLWAVGLQKASVLHSLVLVITAWFAWSFVDQAIAGGTSIMAVLRYLGQASMVIYLTHTIFSAALRIAMLKFGISDLAAVVSFTMLVGVLCPLVVGWGAQRLKLTKVLGF